MYAGIIGDIFDGIIARKLKISTEGFRLLDTIFDLVFYFSILFFIAVVNGKEITNNLPLILCIVTLEGLMYLISLVRFGKLPSPHAIMSKFWGIYIVIEFTLLILGVQGNHFAIALCIGLFVHIDRVLIYILLRQWDHDIPSSYHALLLRQGKMIRRRELFNG
jgi:CDP-diacylglycerol--glycerol-3-phosphate 3-phosphatidyltransferase